MCSHAGESPNHDPEWEARKGFMLNESIHGCSKNGNLSDSKQVKFVSHLRRSGKGQTGIWEGGDGLYATSGGVYVYVFICQNS